MKNYTCWSFFTCLFLVFSSCKEDVNIKKQELISKELLYTPKAPINGSFYGVVELGAAGFNFFIIEADKDLNWKLYHREYGTSLLVEGMTNTMLVNQKLKEYINRLLDHGLSPEDIHFVVSSGAIKEDLTKVIIQELEKLGHVVNRVTPEEEGKYAVKAILPEEFKTNSYLIDIGSGNTKIAYVADDNITVSLETEGAKYYQKGIEDKEVYDEVRKVAAKIPEKNRALCFIIGGVPYQMATYLKNDGRLLTSLDSDVNVYKSIKGKKVASGVNIFKAIQDETKVQQTFYFLNGNFALGFLLSKVK